MKYKNLIITTIVCTSVGFATFAQSRTGEGLSRQVVALKNMMENSANVLRSRLTTVENDLSTVQSDLAPTQNQLTAARNQINALTTEENRRRACNDRSTSSIYWPDHPEANSRGCVSHEDLGTGESGGGQGCGSRGVTWTVGRFTCRGSLLATPHNVTARATDSQGTCSNEIAGNATYRCMNGRYVLENSTCYFHSGRTGECR